MTTLKEYALDALGTAITCGGGFISLPQFEQRLDVCNKCDLFGTVNPLPLIKTVGCQKCGCPSLTKPSTFKHCDLKTGKQVFTTCPHPSGNKWSSVDEKFNGFSHIAIPLNTRIKTIKKVFQT